jgi:hypothetical protein
MAFHSSKITHLTSQQLPRGRTSMIQRMAHIGNMMDVIVRLFSSVVSVAINNQNQVDDITNNGLVKLVTIDGTGSWNIVNRS